MLGDDMSAEQIRDADKILDALKRRLEQPQETGDE